ncbi:LuxR C-terminal-related transcriptional regulator, partial [Escherichia coli]|uniref:LuxR C-terminal-related transcriptional regulator n=1 Tax=Escherichia coli TaxID=562 RepID=UPI00208DB1EB
KSAQIREILISESAWEEMTCLFASSFIGRYLSFTRGNTLTQMEFTIMGYMVSGYNPYQIAEVLDMDIRSIYAYKQRIEKRMGGKINELFIRSHSVQH